MISFNKRSIIGIFDNVDVAADTKMMISGTNGYVGIGTTAPATALHVYGNAIIGGGGSSSLKFDTGTASSYVDI